MSQEVVRKALNALAAIGAVKRQPSAPPQAKLAQEEAVPTYCFNFDTRHSDLYWQAAMTAWRQIAALKHLPGGMAWGARFHPDLYRRATRELSAEWERLWDEAAPLDDFQAALDEWVVAHKELIDLYPVSRGTE